MPQQLNLPAHGLPRFAHQIEGVKFLLDHKLALLADEPRCGKSRQVIDAACILASRGEIDTVLVVAPCNAIGVWSKPEIGQIAQYSWWPSYVSEYRGKMKLILDNADLSCTEAVEKNMHWIVTNYELLRGAKHFDFMYNALCDSKVLLVCDESSYLFNRTAQQTKAIMKLRQHCSRVILLNGTPGDPLDQWSQMNILSPDILKRRYLNFVNFRSEYCQMESIYVAGGRRVSVRKRGAPYKNVERLSKITAPYVLRRLKKDCLDLPPKIGGIASKSPVFREVALSTESWKRYQTLKKDAVVALSNGDLRLEPNAVVRLMRLQQLTSGYLSGYLSNVAEEDFPSEGELPSASKSIHILDGIKIDSDLSNEKLSWCVDYLLNSPSQFTVVWTRWVRERERLVDLIALNGLNARQIHGGQKRNDREAAVQRFTLPDNTGSRHVLIAQPASGGMAIDLPMASEAIYLSNTWRLIDRLQSEERPHSTNRFGEYAVMDVLATGPHGEPTIDHAIFNRLRENKAVSDMTAGEWRSALGD